MPNPLGLSGEPTDVGQAGRVVVTGVAIGARDIDMKKASY